MDFKSRTSLRATSLIELLVCVAIIATLSTIATVCYTGAIDQGDLRNAVPSLVRQLEQLKHDASESGQTIIVEFNVGTTDYTVTTRKGEEVITTKSSVVSHGLLRRPLKFRSYKWPEGGSTPSTFTFAGDSAPQGGILVIGTGYAEAEVRIENGHIISTINV
jgi:Tfp pilus assembly protein FimT